MTMSYVIEEEDKKKATPTPAEGIPVMKRNMSSLSFAVDDSRVEVLTESLIENQKSNIDHFQDLTKRQWDTIASKKDKIVKLK